jgi:alpha-N-acetylglucosamine transferase
MSAHPRRAYVTLVANQDFLPGVRCLLRSLGMVGATAPLVCLVPLAIKGETESVLCGAESRATYEVVVAESLPFSDEFVRRHSNEAIEGKTPMTKGTKPAFHKRLLNFFKLRLWELEQFDKVVFLDADTIVVQNIDILFEYPSFLAAPNLYASQADFHRMNSGVFTASPSREMFSSMLLELDRPGAYWPRTDQSFLESYFGTRQGFTLGLPYTYNTLQYLWFNMPELWRWETIHVVHYQFEKPWDEGSFEGGEASRLRRVLLAPLIDLWREVDRTDTLSASSMTDCRSYLQHYQKELSRLRELVPHG